MYNYFIIKNQDINKDKTKEDLILKYNNDKFICGLPLEKDFIDINKYFSTKPIIPTKYYAVYTKRDFNKDKVKDHVFHYFSMKGEYLLSIPFDFKKLNKKIKKHNENSLVGGKAKKKKTTVNTEVNIEEKPVYVVTKDETTMAQNFKSGIAWGAGRVLIEGIANLFSG